MLFFRQIQLFQIGGENTGRQSSQLNIPGNELLQIRQRGQGRQIGNLGPGEIQLRHVDQQVHTGQILNFQAGEIQLAGQSNQIPIRIAARLFKQGLAQHFIRNDLVGYRLIQVHQLTVLEAEGHQA